MSMFSNPWKSVSEEWNGITGELADPFQRDIAAAAVNLMAHPAAGVMAMSALGLGLASHAFGIWAGMMAGAVQASQGLFAPLAPGMANSATTDLPEARRPAGDPLSFPNRPKPALKVVPKSEPGTSAATASRPAAAPVAQAGSIAPIAEVDEAGALLPEDFHKPASIERPADPDDLKAISGIGPKLEKVLNGLGVWTYAQVAAWEEREIAWMDDYLSFKGRIDRDGWIGQARSLAGAKSSEGK